MLIWAIFSTCHGAESTSVSIFTVWKLWMDSVGDFSAFLAVLLV